LSFFINGTLSTFQYFPSEEKVNRDLVTSVEKSLPAWRMVSSFIHYLLETRSREWRADTGKSDASRIGIDGANRVASRATGHPGDK
jgi:hypothetical protein